MKTLNMNDKQAMEICEKVGQMLAEELNSENVWNKVENIVMNYLKNNNIRAETLDLTDKLEWSVRVKLTSKMRSQVEFLGEKNKGEFTILERKKKREIIEENKQKVEVPPDVGDEEKKALAQTGDDATSGW